MIEAERRSLRRRSTRPSIFELLESRVCLTGQSLDVLVTAVPQASSSSPSLFAANDSVAFFQATNELGEPQFWVTDGTPERSVRVENEFELDEDDRYVVIAEGLVFRDNDALFLVDGNGAIRKLTSPSQVVSAGPYLVNDQVVFVGSTVQNDLMSGETIFSANANSGVAVSLFDGVPEVTRRIGVAGVIANQLVYEVSSSLSTTESVWTSDGTAERPSEIDAFNVEIELTYDGVGVGSYSRQLAFVDAVSGSTTLLDLTPAGKSKAEFERFVATPQGVFLTTYYSDQSAEIWQTDGTVEGTQRVRMFQEDDDFRTRPKDLVWYDEQLFFSDHHQLWSYDPSNKQLRSIYQFNPTATEPPGNLFVAGGSVFFSADGGDGVELWTTDGTVSGTRQVLDLNPSFESLPADFAQAGQRLTFSATHVDVGRELWTLDLPTGEVQLLKDIRRGLLGAPTTTANASSWYEHNGVAYYLLNTYTLLSGREIWRTDGTPEGTYLLRDIAFGSGHSDAHSPYGFGEWVYFFADDGIHGSELWRTNGSDRTEFIKDIAPGFADSVDFRSTPSFTAWNDEVYFWANDGTHGRELWRTDGTSEGTILVQDFLQGPDSSEAVPMVGTDDGLLFYDRNWQDSLGPTIVRWTGEGAEIAYSRDNFRGSPSIGSLIWEGELFIAEARTNGSLLRFDQEQETFDVWTSGFSFAFDRTSGELRIMSAQRSGLIWTNNDGTTEIFDPTPGADFQVVDGRVYFTRGGDRRSLQVLSYGLDDASLQLHMGPFRFADLHAGESHALAVVRRESTSNFEVWVLGDDPGATKVAEFEDAPTDVSEVGGKVLILFRDDDGIQTLLSVPVPSSEESKAAEVDALFLALREQSDDPRYDYNSDEKVDDQDVDYLFREVRKTTPADLNLNGTVDFADFLALSANFGKTNALWSDGDIDGDGQVVFADFLILSSLFGETLE